MEYNSQKSELIIPEYGRHVQQMVDLALTIEDREERNKVAAGAIKVMGQLFPHLRDMEDYKHKLWDHLHIMSDFKLDVDSPYEKPSPEELQTKPGKVNYPKGNTKFSHYGTIIQDVITYAATLEPSEDRDKLTVQLANLMKKHFLSYSRSNVDDAFIKNQLKEMSGGVLEVPEETELVSTQSVLQQLGSNQKRSNNNKGKKKGNNHKGKKRR